MEIGGSNIANSVKDVMTNLKSQGSELRSDMQKISSMKAEDQQMAMIQLNYKLGQYNAMMEMSSSILSNLTDSLKSIANKA